MCGTAHKQHAPLSIVEVMLPPRDGTAEVSLVTKVLVDEVILTADEDTTRTIATSRDGYKKVSCVFKRLTVLSDDVVKTKIQLIEGEHLLSHLGSLSSGVVVRLLQGEGGGEERGRGREGGIKEKQGRREIEVETVNRFCSYMYGFLISLSFPFLRWQLHHST